MGLHTIPQGSTIDELRRQWHIADCSGFDWVSVFDHLYPTETEKEGPCFEATALLGALATETRNVRVCCMVYCIGYRNPALLAKSAVTIDHLSNGRLELGLGAGWYEREHLASGIPFPPIQTRIEMLEEGVQIIKSMLEQEETTFIGKHYKVERVPSYPRPVQDKVKIWIGGLGERYTLRIVARYADCWNSPWVPPEVYRRKLQVLEGWCAKAERNLGEIERSINIGFYMGANDLEARRKPELFPKEWQAREEKGGVWGTPSEVVDLMGQYADAGVQGFDIGVKAPIDWDALQAFIEEVMPAFS